MSERFRKPRNCVAISRWISQAEECHEKALAIASEISDSAGAAEAHTNLGAPSQLLDEDHKAKEYHERALSVTMETGDWETEAILHCTGTVTS